MPKPFHGEPVQLIEAGEYDAIITQVVNLGHQTFKGKEATKFWVEFWIPNLNASQPLSNFGIMTWLSPSKPPFVGFYELISAAEKIEKPSQDFLKEYDLYALAGKSMKVVFSENEKGYMNISAVKPYDGTASLKTEQPIITVGTEDFMNPELLETINEKARNIIWSSREFMETPGEVDKTVEYAKRELGGTEVEQTIRIEDVPF